jgi:secondary thiamine-phosphate synthase enzyme
MESERRVLSVETNQPEAIVDITDRVKECLNESDLTEGLVSVFPLHTSSAVIINDSDSHLLDDLQALLDDLVPGDREYAHNDVDPKQNATAHLKSILTGHHVTIPVTNGAFDFGTYHTIYYAEFDGQRPKEILVKMIGEKT